MLRARWVLFLLKTIEPGCEHYASACEDPGWAHNVQCSESNDFSMCFCIVGRLCCPGLTCQICQWSISVACLHPTLCPSDRRVFAREPQGMPYSQAKSDIIRLVSRSCVVDSVLARSYSFDPEGTACSSTTEACTWTLTFSLSRTRITVMREHCQLHPIALLPQKSAKGFGRNPGPDTVLRPRVLYR